MSHEIKRIQSVQELLASSKVQRAPLSDELSIPFQSYFNDAMVQQSNSTSLQAVPLTNLNAVSLNKDIEKMVAQIVTEDELEQIERQYRQERESPRGELTPRDVNQELIGTERLQFTPFQLFMDKAVDVLESISNQEFRVNDLTEQYIQGKVSIDEVSIEATKLNLAVSFATTVITTASQTLKEFIGMQV